VGLHRLSCPGVDAAAADRLAYRLASEAWFSRALDAAAASGLPDAWIGAGVIRDIVWGPLAGGFTPASVKDIDVAFFDPDDLGPTRDEAAEKALQAQADLPWEATNQAAVHTWYHRYFGGAPVAAFRGIHEAVASWPETGTVWRFAGPSRALTCAHRTGWPTCSTASGGAIRPGSVSASPKSGSRITSADGRS
jgi:hypothetical protein